jgi:hypothetical protein
VWDSGRVNDTCGYSVFVVSSGPTKYGTVVLPDADIVTELQSRGQVFRTDTNDSACAVNPSKIGSDDDGHAGGCDNIRLVIGSTPAVQTSVFHGVD